MGFNPINLTVCSFCLKCPETARELTSRTSCCPKGKPRHRFVFAESASTQPFPRQRLSLPVGRQGSAALTHRTGLARSMPHAWLVLVQRRPLATLPQQVPVQRGHNDAVRPSGPVRSGPATSARRSTAAAICGSAS